MWKLPDSIARRFPLVARPRPACLPLHQRVQALADLADTAHKQSDPSMASTVFNQAALIASDVGLPDIARTLCTQHAAAYLCATPLPSEAAVRTLEPAVNLARLQLRAGHPDTGRQLLLTLFDAITHNRPAQIESITVPTNLVATDADRKKVRTWLWTVLLADGTRALTTQGRWDEALAHIELHRGIGTRMLDGRQVAVLAALTTGDTSRARDLLDHTTPGDPWEQLVTASLMVLCHLATGKSTTHPAADVADAYLQAPAGHGTTLFDIRLGLTILAAARSASHTIAHDLVDDLHRRTMEAQDGYAAREALTDTQFTELTSERQKQQCRDLLRACALDSGDFPDDLLSDLLSATRAADRVIRESILAI